MAKKKTRQTENRRPAKKVSRKSTSAESNSAESSRKRPFDSPGSMEQRLQRALASAGLGSRRECETLIEEGRVEVDGEFVTTLGVKVNPQNQKIRVDGSIVKFPRLQYFAVNKPPGVVSTSKDPSGRLRVIDLINTEERVYNVGRLDKSSEGLILVTNDGDLANRLTHPRYGVQKIYLVQVAGHAEVSELKKLQQGVYLAEGLAKVVGAKVKKRTKDSTWLEITLDEGRNREIRRLLARIGNKVLRLRRVAIGSLRLGDLPVGAHRRLDRKEIESLWYSSSRQRETEKKTRHRNVSKKTSRRPSKKRRSEETGSSSKSRFEQSDSTSTGRRRAKPKPGQEEWKSKSPAKRKRRSTKGQSETSSSRYSKTESPPKRKAKPKPGQEGWKPKSGGKRKKKKSTAVKRSAASTSKKRNASKSKRKRS